jgi:DNA-binding NarL/FixJ family response regulator
VPFQAELKKINEELAGNQGVGEVELVNLLEKSWPNLILVDISLLNAPAMNATSNIKKNYPDANIIIMIMDGKNEYLAKAVGAEADGLLLKQTGASLLTTAIDKIRQGERTFPKMVIGGKPGGNTMRFDHQCRRTFQRFY